MIYDEAARWLWIFHLWVIKHRAAVSDEARYNKGGKEGWWAIFYSLTGCKSTMEPADRILAYRLIFAKVYCCSAERDVHATATVYLFNRSFFLLHYTDFKIVFENMNIFLFKIILVSTLLWCLFFARRFIVQQTYS